jgi:spore coat polysaccharide biosynthesis predicted glycosyltransferase SpsG
VKSLDSHIHPKSNEGYCHIELHILVHVCNVIISSAGSILFLMPKFVGMPTLVVALALVVPDSGFLVVL